MGLVVQHNLPAINAQNQLRVNLSNNQKATEKLSSGYRINRAGDDAAGLAISEKMRGQIRGLDQASANAQDGISLIQTAEGALQETHSILQRMRELAVQSANGTYQNEVDRENINKEVDALKSEIDRISSSTHFNGKKLLDGSMSGDEVDGLAITGAAGGSAKIDGIAATGTANTETGATIAFAGVVSADAETAKAVNELSNYLNKTGVSITNADTSPAADNATIEIGGGYTATQTGTTAVWEIEKDGTKIGDITIAGTFTSNEGKSGISKAGDVTTAVPALAEGETFVVNGSGELVLQIGANGDADQRVALSVEDQSSAGLGVNAVNVSTRSNANTSIDLIDKAINSVSGTRADLGALQNRLEHTINNLTTSSENLTAAESRIRDTDMAKEMMNYTKSNILQQAAQAMLAQANVQPQSVLQLLG